MAGARAFLGQVLAVDLTSGTTSAEPFSEALAHRLLAGRGFNSNFLLGALPDGADPLGPENVLLLSGGLLTGTEAPASSRLHVSARSPLTGLLGSSNVGAQFGAALRAAGWQAIVISGAAASPVSLVIEPGKAILQDASAQWGWDTWRTQEALAPRLGEKRARVMAIGPAGERRVRYACVMTERGHAAGRTGMGAVMGAKRLKAIAVGGGEYPYGTRPEVRQAVHAYADAIRQADRYPVYSRYSNSGFVTWADENGILATRNYRQNRFAGAAAIDGKRLIDYVTKPKGCHRCPVHCKAEIRVEHGRFAGLEGERPDIEPIVALGSKCGLADPEAVLYLYNLCGRLGLDVISAASCLAFAMDLREQGLLTAADTDGLDLVWGNAEAMEAMLLKIAAREGLGDVLAEGVARAAAAIGRGAEASAHHSKGLELTAYDPRGGKGTALGYAVSPRGGDFTSVYAVPEYRWSAQRGLSELGSAAAVDRFSAEGKGILVKHTMCVSAALDALGLCKVPALSVVGDFSLAAEARLASALTGWEISAADLLTVGERIANLERLFNLRFGLRPELDTLPEYFRQHGLATEPGAGSTVQIEPMVQDFYRVMGWDQHGVPNAGRLLELGLA